MQTITKRVVIYARVSKPPRNRKLTLDQQKAEGLRRDQDVNNQLLKLREFVASYELIDSLRETKTILTLVHEYVDRKSAKNSDRESLQKMFAAAERKEFDIVLFWSLDRFSREGTLKTLNHLEYLAQQGVDFVSYQEQFVNSTGPFKDAIIGFLAAIAKQERVRISERTKAGLDRLRDDAEARGETITFGRPSIVSALRVQILDLHSQGITNLFDIQKRVEYKTAAGEIRKPSTATIRRALKVA